MLAILDAGMRIPEDIALVGVGNHLNVDLLRVPLTSIDLDCSGIGALSASMLLGLINSKEDTHPKAEFTTPKLVERASSLH
jgi:LacI family transcriptional regulator